MSMDTEGSPKNFRFLSKVESGDNVNSPMVLAAINRTGDKATKKLLANEGIADASKAFISTKPTGGLAMIFFKNSGKINPAAMMANVAGMKPKSKVLPISALNI